MPKEERDDYLKKILGIVIMCPAFFVGFSEMYHPQNKPQDWFLVLLIASFCVGLIYFFAKEVKELFFYVTNYKNGSKKAID